jgi:hypothetical protein
MLGIQRRPATGCILSGILPPVTLSSSSLVMAYVPVLFAG